MNEGCSPHFWLFFDERIDFGHDAAQHRARFPDLHMAAWKQHDAVAFLTQSDLRALRDQPVILLFPAPCFPS